jgi:hypothetical protein
VRFAQPGEGKRGGYRIITFFSVAGRKEQTQKVSSNTMTSAGWRGTWLNIHGGHEQRYPILNSVNSPVSV